jgi:hypothetical protein
MNKKNSTVTKSFGTGQRKWFDDDHTFRFGKHEGESLYDVADDDPRYLVWMLDEVEISSEEASLVESALDDAGEDY